MEKLPEKDSSLKLPPPKGIIPTPKFRSIIWGIVLTASSHAFATEPQELKKNIQTDVACTLQWGGYSIAKNMFPKIASHNLLCIRNPGTGERLVIESPQVLSFDSKNPTVINERWRGIVEGKLNGRNTTYRIWEVVDGVIKTEYIVDAIKYHIPTGLARQIEKDENEFASVKRICDARTIEKQKQKMRKDREKYVSLNSLSPPEQYEDYTPFHPGLDTQENREKWLRYLQGIVHAWKNFLLNDAQFESIWPVIKNIDSDLVLYIILNEKIDPVLAKKWESLEDFHLAINRALVMFAVNADRAYMTQQSSTWARGVTQIMPSSFSLLQKKFHFSGTFDEWVSKHERSVALSFLHIADDVNTFGQLPNKEKFASAFTGSGAIPLNTVYAISYNSGMGQTMTAVKGWVSERTHCIVGRKKQKGKSCHISNVSYEDFLVRTNPEPWYYARKLPIIRAYITARWKGLPIPPFSYENR